MLTIYMESFNVILIIFVLTMPTMHVECFISCRHIIWNALTVYKIKVGCNLDLFPKNKRGIYPSLFQVAKINIFELMSC